jgi:26S proteasome regulatory subunit N1
MPLGISGLAATYVNAFVNAGFGKDLLLSSGD